MLPTSSPKRLAAPLSWYGVSLSGVESIARFHHRSHEPGPPDPDSPYALPAANFFLKDRSKNPT